jgi:hypothetical protein
MFRYPKSSPPASQVLSSTILRAFSSFGIQFQTARGLSSRPSTRERKRLSGSGEIPRMRPLPCRYEAFSRNRVCDGRTLRRIAAGKWGFGESPWENSLHQHGRAHILGIFRRGLCRSRSIVLAQDDSLKRRACPHSRTPRAVICLSFDEEGKNFLPAGGPRAAKRSA